MQTGSVGSLTSVYQHLRLVQLKMALFNQVNEWPVFGVKLLCNGCNLVFGFAAIQIFHGDRPLSAISAIIVLESLGVFHTIYSQGFSIPRRMKRLRSSLVMKLGKFDFVTDQRRGILKRQVESIGNVAVRVGQFHYLERISTPRYLDFCVKNIMRLVMAYRR